MKGGPGQSIVKLDIFRELYEEGVKGKPGFTAGIFLEFPLNKMKSKFFFVSEALLTYRSASTPKETTYFRQLYFHVPVLLRYSYPINKTRLFINMGVSPNILLFKEDRIDAKGFGLMMCIM